MRLSNRLVQFKRPISQKFCKNITKNISETKVAIACILTNITPLLVLQKLGSFVIHPMRIISPNLYSFQEILFRSFLTLFFTFSMKQIFGLAISLPSHILALHLQFLSFSVRFMMHISVNCCGTIDI